MIGSLQVWRRRVRALGARNACLLAVKRILVNGSGGWASLVKYQLVAQPVPAARWLSSRRGRDIDVRPLHADSPELDSLPRPKHVIKARFEQGAECLCAFRKGAVVGCLWYTRGDYEEDEVRCLFSPRPQDLTAWDFDIYVDPAYRLGPTFLRLWDEANERLRTAGVCWSLSRIDSFNVSSLQAHKRLGAVKLGSLTFVTLGGLQWMMGSRPGWSGASRDPARRPVVKIDVEELERRRPDAGSGRSSSRDSRGVADVAGGN